MAKNLVIVESPAKAGTIEKYLGPEYQVMASMGHVRDLPASKLGVEVEKEFQPTYVIPPKARKTITSLKNALKDKESVYLATDLDREGEAIAWHISQALDLDQRSIRVARITFDEITKPAITAAITHPRSLNQQLVDAQQARRVLDRLVGYTLSPVLWKKIYKGLSAGRVQSVALRLIVDRERERQDFKPVEYWTLKALLAKQSGERFLATLTEYQKKKIEQQTIKTEAEVQKIIDGLGGADYRVQKVEKKPVKRHPYAPYTTSTLQQDGVNKLQISSKRLMQVAQKLYEAGLITYMRTDSVSLADTAVAAIREKIQADYGQTYLPAKPNYYRNKSKNAQEAHEAIRPTDPSRRELDGDAVTKKVYDLIWRRAVASQMQPAELEQTTATVAAKEAVFRASGQRIVFPGFLKVWGSDNKEEQLLLVLKEGEAVQLQELQSEQHFTEPPPRYTEASLIKTLEELGIGRPSTYAPTIDTLIQRRYVTVEQRRFTPEEAGYLVTDLLVQHFPEIVDQNFTADMEEKLDRVATGEARYGQILSNFWEPFSRQVEENTSKIEKVDTSQPTDQLCPACGAPMVIKMGRYGKFLACTRFPECKTTQPLIATEPTGLICPACGKPLVQKRARKGIFFGCSGYPACTVALWKKEQLPAKIEELAKEGAELPYRKESLEAFSKL
ncbi:type I DNA topoisomerase [Patescibacteria group bacterium]|nr:type I DNA topoisomerase [Patescibacteria group bacterium]